MTKRFYPIFLIVFCCAFVQAQTTILDFEKPATSTVFQYFGSPLDGSLTSVIANPNASGINTSANVTKYTKPAVAEVWAGAFSNPNPTTLVDLVANGKVTIKVHMDHIGSVSLKLEGSTDMGDNWVTTVANTKKNEWEELTFDVNLPSIEAPFKPAAGHKYARVVLFFDFGTAGTGTEVISYFDDIVAAPASALVCNTILDMEKPATTTVFQYFGSPLDGSLNSNIPNPNPSGINTSSTVGKFTKPAVAEVWAGAFSNPNPTAIVDLVNNGKIKVKVHMDHIGSLSLKLEGSPDMGDNWVITVPNTKVNEWEELVFDANLPSIEAPFKPSKGHTYARVVLFFDFGTAGTGKDVISYFDDICVEGSGGPSVRTVNFKVDMNKYSSNFDKVYLSGTFNNWSGDANQLTDANLDGIFEGSISVPVGAYEYKVTLDNWKVEEKFTGTEECVVIDPSGMFVNRRLLVTGDTTPQKFCFNSCYACGEEVKILFKLGMGSVTPSPDGIWLAGGGNFDNPGGRFKMKLNTTSGAYEILVPRKRGFKSYFTFTNGNCPDYSCKEKLDGLPCGDPGNFNDRRLPEVSKDTTYATCFGLCSIDASCTPNSTNDLQFVQNLFEIWGNPSDRGYSLLFFNVTNESKQVRLHNSLGQLVKSWNIDNAADRLEIKTTDLSAGLYHVSVYTATSYETKKFIKN